MQMTVSAGLNPYVSQRNVAYGRSVGEQRHKECYSVGQVKVIRKSVRITLTSLEVPSLTNVLGLTMYQRSHFASHPMRALSVWPVVSFSTCIEVKGRTCV